MKMKWAVKRFVENQPGFTRHGEPVHDVPALAHLDRMDALPALWRGQSA